MAVRMRPYLYIHSGLRITWGGGGPLAVRAVAPLEPQPSSNIASSEATSPWLAQICPVLAWGRDPADSLCSAEGVELDVASGPAVRIVTRYGCPVEV